MQGESIGMASSAPPSRSERTSLPALREISRIEDHSLEMAMEAHALEDDQSNVDKSHWLSILGKGRFVS